MTSFYKPCQTCQSRGKIASVSKRTQSRYLKNLRYFELGQLGDIEPKAPVPHVDMCQNCAGTGLIASEQFPELNFAIFPHVAIIGGGIGGIALAVACLHRGIPYTLYERDVSFDARSQGYGLTLQQASKALEGLGIPRFQKGVTSIIHIVHDEHGKVIGEWGRRKVNLLELEKHTKRRNVHIPRQVLRSDLREALVGDRGVLWGHTLTHFAHEKNGKIKLEFDVGGKKKSAHADLVVGADGIHSRVRAELLGEQTSPLQYLGCIVILGICPLESLSEHPLLDGETVFQTVNGYERIYMMPYNEHHIMWQLSYPIDQEEAKMLSKKGAEALKYDALHRLGKWHDPIPEILTHTPVSRITGYPVYDRKALHTDDVKDFGNVTLIGDAMHPMSPFKGQGANQAILDALELARDIYEKCGTDSQWREKGLRKTVLEDFELQMLKRSMTKVQDSATQAALLHSQAVLHDGDMPRGRGIKI